MLNINVYINLTSKGSRVRFKEELNRGQVQALYWESTKEVVID